MTDLTRFEDWRSRLSDEMDRQRQIPFKWGGHDCFLGLVVETVRAITGADIGRGFRGRYKSERKAAAVLADDGFASLGDLVASLLPEHEHHSQARIGDIGVVDSGNDGGVGEGLCIVDASGVVVLTAEGHGRLPRDAMKRAFKVG